MRNGTPVKKCSLTKDLQFSQWEELFRTFEALPDNATRFRFVEKLCAKDVGLAIEGLARDADDDDNESSDSGSDSSGSDSSGGDDSGADSDESSGGGIKVAKKKKTNEGAG